MARVRGNFKYRAKRAVKKTQDLQNREFVEGLKKDGRSRKMV
jgi:hypothetical protein